MNIYGYKLKLREINKELREGVKKLGTSRYNHLKRISARYKYNIQKLRNVKKTKRR